MDTFNPNQMPPLTANSNKKPVGPLISVIVILAIIIIGGLYFLKERANQPVYAPSVENQDEVAQSLNTQGSSDDLNSIESDLKSTNVENIDQGSSSVEAELQ